MMWAIGCNEEKNEDDEGDGDLGSQRRRRRQRMALGEERLGVGGNVGVEVGVCEYNRFG